MKSKINIPNQIVLPQNTHIDIPMSIQFTGEFSEASCANFVRQLLAIETHALKIGQKIIPVFIDSFGGDIYGLLSCIDAINSLDPSLKVATIVTGKAMSAGAILFSCGAEGHRYISENGTILIHNALSVAEGSVQDLQIGMAEVTRLNNKIMNIIAKNIGKKESFIKELLNEKENRDMYIDAKQAVAYNLANKIGIPSQTVNIIYDIKFEEPVQKRVSSPGKTKNPPKQVKSKTQVEKKKPKQKTKKKITKAGML